MAGPETPFGGKVLMDGVEVADVRGHTINEVHESKPYNSSATAGVTKRLQGNTDWTATITLYVDEDGKVPIAKGDYVAVKLYSDATHGREGNAWVDGVTYEVDIEDKAINAATIEVSGDGALADI